MTRFLFLTFFLLALPAAAQDRVSVLIGSHHAGAAAGAFEGHNPGLILTWEDRGGLDLFVAAYRNSYGRTSVAALAGLPVAHWRGGAASVVAGLAWYPQDGRTFPVHAGDVVPLIGLQLRHHNAFVLIIPGDGKAADAVIAAGITFRLEPRP